MNNKITIYFEEYKELQKIAIESTKIVDLEEAYKKEKYLVDKLTRQLTDEYKNTEYQCKEKDRLNNIINELEIFLNKVASTSTGETITCNNILKYLQELKENKQ